MVTVRVTLCLPPGFVFTMVRQYGVASTPIGKKGERLICATRSLLALF